MTCAENRGRFGGGGGGQSADKSKNQKNGSVMNPVILLFLRVGLVAVGWLALSAQAAPVLPSSLDVGKSN